MPAAEGLRDKITFALRFAQGEARFLLLLLTPIALSAQSPAERAMLSAWDDSLQHVPNAIALSAYDAPSRHRSGRISDLRRGLFLVRRAAFSGGRGDVELTLTNMQVLVNHTKWGWPHFVMARAFDVMSRKEWIETISDGKQPAEKHSDAVWRTLRMALDADHTFPNARRFLGALTAAGGDRFLRSDQVLALERESREPDADADALLAWGRHLRTLQDYHRALAMFDRSLQSGGDRSRLQLERARTLLAIGDTSSAIDAYWDGAERLSYAGRVSYRYDLWWIAEPEELTAFDEMPDSLAGSWLRRFWNTRDAEAANNRGERLAEHLRRWAVAYERYRALSPWIDAFWSRVEMKFDQGACTETDAKLYERLWQHPPTIEGDLRSHEPIIDHRGMLYLRHGEPTRIINAGGRGGAPVRRRTLGDPYTAAPQAIGPTGVRFPWSTRAMGEVPDMTSGPTAESWIYWWDGELRVISFRGSQALGTYGPTTLTEATPLYLMITTVNASTMQIKEYYDMAVRIRQWNDSSVFGSNGPRSFAAHHDNPACFNEVRAVLARTARDDNASVNRDTDTPPNFRGQNSVAQMFALGVAADRSSGILATFAIPGNILTPEPLEDGQVGYTIAWRIVAYDKIANQTYSLDTVRRFTSPRALGPREYLTGYTEFGLRAGNWHIASRASQVGGATVVQDVHPVRVDGADALTLSDIVTGRPGNPTWTATDDEPFPLNYPNGWYSGEVAELFFELRGVPAGESYRTTMEVRPAGIKAEAAIRIQSTDPTSGEVTRVRKSLGLSQLLPGRYILAVTVTYQGRTATREREILIVAR